MSARSWKLHEFVAHGGNVTSVALGRKRSRVMVTGSEDKKVNVWSMGNPKCIMSLQGHTSAVEAVCLGSGEEVVLAGSASGAIKIWNLEQAKVVRTLTGHRANVRSIDCHPYGDFAATGAVDNCIKLWDLKRKGCIFNYKGHTDSITCLRFSPDGRWIVSASQDSTIKLWDLNAGKLLTELSLHTAAVSWVEFHPNEFLLASASADKTVKFWDLESFELVDSSEPECNPIRALAFHPDGSCLYSASQEQLRVHGWEPAQLHDSLNVGWGRVSDVTITNNQLVGCSYNGPSVSLYVVDLQRVQPHGAPQDTARAEGKETGAEQKSDNRQSPRKGPRHRHLFERPETQSSSQQNKYHEEPEEARVSPEQEEQSFVRIESRSDYNDIFSPQRTLARSPTRAESPFQPPPEVEKPREAEPVSKAPPKSDKPRAERTARAEPQERGEPSPRSRDPRPRNPPPVAKESPRVEGEVRRGAQRQTTKPEATEVDPASFLQKPQQPVLSSELDNSSDMSESEAIASIMKGHGTMQAVLNAKCKNLQVVRALWTSDSVRVALEQAVNMNDQAVLVDLLNVVNQKTSLWSLDIAALMMPHVRALFSSKYESYQQTGCDSLKVVMNQFGSLIKDTVRGPPPIGVDLTREERNRKCQTCYYELQAIRSIVEAKPSGKGTLASNFRQIKLMLENLD